MPSSRTLSAKNGLLYVIIAFVLAPLFAIAEETDIPLNYLEGTSRKKTSGSEGWLKLDSDSKIGIGDSVKTLEDGKLEFRISDGIFRMGANTLITISPGDSREYNDGKAMNLIAGELWTIINSVNDRRQGIFLPHASVFGADFVARFSAGDDGTAEIKIYEGELEISRLVISTTDSTDVDIDNDTAGDGETLPESWSMTLESGEKLIISSRGEITYRNPFSPDDPDENTDWVRWNKDRDNK